MRVLVCGGRKFDDYRAVATMLSSIHPRPTLIIHGNANGADKLADSWASVAGIKRQAYPANWRKYGKKAGPLRNQQMIDEGRPDLVVAFPGGAGTIDMTTRAYAAGIEVRLWTPLI